MDYKGVNLEHYDDIDRTPFALAVERHHLGVLRLLGATEEVNINTSGGYRHSMLFEAVSAELWKDSGISSKLAI